MRTERLESFANFTPCIRSDCHSRGPQCLKMHMFSASKSKQTKKKVVSIYNLQIINRLSATYYYWNYH